ncbi:MAG: hypothetical protein HYX92_06985 [Chloroflexi bacterium]|nr:hypothetical protein [Chloroflexota bacterium]
MEGNLPRTEERSQSTDGWQRLRARMRLEKRIHELQDEIKRLERQREELG